MRRADELRGALILRIFAVERFLRSLLFPAVIEIIEGSGAHASSAT